VLLGQDKNGDGRDNTWRSCAFPGGVVAARPWEHADKARAALQAIVADPSLGLKALSGEYQAANALEDLLPDAPRERAILVMAVKAGLVPALQDYIAQGIDAATAVNLVAAGFEESSPLDPEACRWVVSELAIALGLMVPEFQPHDEQTVTADSRLAGPQAIPVRVPTVLAAVPAERAAQGAGGAVGPRATGRAGAVPGHGAEISGWVLGERGAVAGAPEPGRDRHGGGKNRGARVNRVAFSPDGQLLVTAGSDGLVRIWAVGTGQLVSKFGWPSGQVRSVAFSPDGLLVAAAHSDGPAQLWSASSLVRAVTPVAAWDVAFSTDGRLLATAGGGRTSAGLTAAAAPDKAAWLWDVATGRVAGGVAGKGGHASAVAFSPAGGLFATASASDVVRLWEVSTGRQVWALPRPAGQADRVAFSPDGRLLATAGAGSIARLWDIATGALAGPVGVEPAADVGFSPDGQLLATAGGGSRSAPGVAARVTIDKAVWLWDVATGSSVARLAGHDDAVQSVAFCPGTGVLATSSRDRTVRLWDLVPAIRPNSN
jgi:WD40 repeat protein